jgi:hypothetical protein
MTLTKVQSGFIDLTTSAGLTVGAGSASTPALNFGDSSTGIFKPATNEVAIALSGSQKFTFKNNNFGIGTNSPDVPLVVVGNTKISGNTHIGSPSGSSAKLAVYRATQYAGNPVFEAYSNLTGNSQTKVFEVDGDGSVLVDGGIGVDTSGTLELRQRGDTKDDGIALSSSHATAHRLWKNSAGRFNIGTTSDSDQLFITQASAPNGYIGLNKPVRLGVGDGGVADYGTVGNGTLSTTVTSHPWYTGGGRHYIQLDANPSNDAAGCQDPAYISWKGSVSSNPGTSIPNGGYMARIGGYRDLINDGSTSLCWESVVDTQSANPHIPTRHLTLRYNGKIGFGNEIEPACLVDMSQDTSAICLPKGTTAQRSGFTNESGQIRFNTEVGSLEFYTGTSWRDVSEGAISSTSGDYVVTTSGFKYHFFHNSGTFANIGGSQTAEIFVIGGGGGGGGGTNNGGSGGGGGGGLVFGTINISNGNHTVTIGAGGAGGITSSGNAGSTGGSAGGTSSIVVDGTTFQSTGGGGGLSDGTATSPNGNAGGTATNSSGVGASTGGAGGTGTIDGGTSYTGPDGTASVYGTGGTGGFGGSKDSSNNGAISSPGLNGTNNAPGGGGGGQNNKVHGGQGGNGTSAFYTGGGGGGGYDNDGNATTHPTPANSLDGGTGYFDGGDGGDMQGTAGQIGGKPTGSAGTNYSGGGTTAGSVRFNNGGGGGAYGAGGGGAADANNSPDAHGGSGAEGVVIIKYSV